MSLDVYLNLEGKTVSSGSGIFVRENGQKREISREEWDVRYPDRETVIVETTISDDVYSANITHNLNKMADMAGIYEHLWRPDELGIEKAKELIEPLQDGLLKLKYNPDYYKQYNPSNGWGSYEGLIKFVENYIEACESYPEADVSVSR